MVQKIGPIAYKLLLPSEAKIHLVFHVSQLKDKLGGELDPTLPIDLLRKFRSLSCHSSCWEEEWLIRIIKL